eukprot:gb/GECH01012402.1/.p1 GENE.gb/GECH01012402.1/~~gb/GECH01012402.1/.p1  ORF type:complete len:771 (+),score=201.68 gb/GECH01012402.1/:1-2313(+)
MQLFVNTPLTRTLSFQAEPFTTIEEIKKKTQEREGIPIECQRLVYATKQLNDQNTLADYNISKDSTLFLLLRLKGGMQIQIKTTTGRTLTLDVDPSETLRTVKQKVAVKEGIPPEYQRLVFCSGSGSNTDNNNNNDNSENFLNYTNQEEQDQPIGQQVFRRGKKRRRTNDGNYVESENDSSFSFTLHTQPQPSLQDFQDLHDKKQQNNQQLQQQQQQEQQQVSIPIGSISKVTWQEDRLRVICKAGQRLHFFGNFQLRQLPEHIKVRKPSIHSLFAFQYKEYFPGQRSWNVFNPVAEFQRQGAFNNDNWRVTTLNEKYGLCPTYPQFLMVPQSIPDSTIKQAAPFRSKKRIPALTWMHPTNGTTLSRCSQPCVGISRARSYEDEALVRSIRQTSSSNVLYIFDCRPMANAICNAAMGKGYESTSYYEQCDVKFLSIENIHRMRESLSSLGQLLWERQDTERWLSHLEGTGWLEHLRLVLLASKTIVSRIEDDASPVMVHCSDGWDRTAQVCGLAQILLDPYYRSIEGFQVLIEKDWISFGHQFEQRCGHLNSESDQVSPIFLQFIDCVWQITQQYPTAFEFNETFLLDILEHVTSCRFGTFLVNSEQQREDAQLPEKTVSLWSYINYHKSSYKNLLYRDSQDTGRRILMVDCSARVLQLWTKCYCMYSPQMQEQYRYALGKEVQNLHDEVENIKEKYQGLESELERMKEKNKQYKERLKAIGGSDVIEEEPEDGNSNDCILLAHIDSDDDDSNGKYFGSYELIQDHFSSS